MLLPPFAPSCPQPPQPLSPAGASWGEGSRSAEERARTKPGVAFRVSRQKLTSVDWLAKEGLPFASGYASSATCTPPCSSRLSGEYAFRRKGKGVLPGDAALIIEPGRTTVPARVKKSGSMKKDN